jgi:hypothetical protein
MEKKRICISLDISRYDELREQAHERGFGSGKYALNAYVHYLLVNRMSQYEWNKTGRKDRDKKGSIYIIQAGKDGPVKIGITDKFSSRLVNLQVSCPYKIHVISVIPNCTYQDEHDLHEKYKHFLIHGEWFEKAVLDFINEDIKALQVPSEKPTDLPTGTGHYLYLMEA